MTGRAAALLVLAFAIAGGSAGAQPVEPPPASVMPSPVMPSPASAPLPPAGVVPAALALDVTGSPVADASFLDAQIRAELDRRIRPTLRPGAYVTYGPIVPWPLLPLPFGERAAVNVTVLIAGDASSAPVAAITTVTLTSVAVAPVAPAVLFLSDDPEYLLSEGLIFRGDVSAGRPARLYYYQSQLGVPRDLDVVLTSTAPARVQLIQSASGPDLDVMSVGHTVTRDFLQYRSDNEGTVVDVVPGTPYIVRHALLLHGEVVAGTVDVQLVSGGTVGISVVGSPAGSPPDPYLRGPRVAFDGHRRHGTFDLAGFGALAGVFTVGGPPAAAQYGGKLPTPRNLDPADDGHDYGDYGITHRLTFTLSNPTDAAQNVYLYEKPLGGPVRSSFIVDGRLTEIGCVRLPLPYAVMTYRIPPHTTGASTIVTMTDGGSFYPLEFGVTDQRPVLYPPPVGSPNGCSPSLPSSPVPVAAAP